MQRPLPRARLVPAVIFAFGLVLMGCGNGGSTTTVINKTVTVAQPATTTTSTQTGSGTDKSPAQILHLSTFRSPTGVIGCALIGGEARCDIAKRDWSPPPRPASCPKQVDFGQGLEVGRSGPARPVCAGDTALDPTGRALGYGSASRIGDFSCISRSTGMTCTNSVTGHGFFISIQSYRAF
jgi:hypothetical protein